MEAEDILRQPMAPDNDTVSAVRGGLSNIEAEQMVLGAILINNEAFYRADEVLQPEDFSEGLHERIYRTAGRLIEQGHVASPISLAPYFERDAAIIEIGGTDYLARMAAWATSMSLVSDYARLVHTLAMRRGLIDVGQELVDASVHAKVDDKPEDLITEAEKSLYSLAETGKKQSGFVPFHSALELARQMAENAYKRDGHLSGLATKLRDLDVKLGGLQQSDLIVLAGRPGKGKTSLATNIDYNVAAQNKPDPGDEIVNNN